MARDEELKKRWNSLVEKLSLRFADGAPLDLDGIIYLIGVQELGQLHRQFKKDEKVNLMHIAICRLLCPRCQICDRPQAAVRPARWL